MRVLHVTPHLGGGIGKAHAVISRVLPKNIKQTFVLLEKPIDTRFVQMIQSQGGRVIVAENLEQIAELAKESDIVQFEFINHPRLFECLARTNFPEMRSVFWAHISGIFKPIIQPKLMSEASRFVFTSEISSLLAGNLRNTSVINSGFGFGSAIRNRTKRWWPKVAYLGTVNFVKMHPGFFDVIDKIDHVETVLIWGHIDKAVAQCAANMKNPKRVQFFGETLRPADSLSLADIFFYPLQPKHYGTGENSLVEAMSMGLVPIVMNNPAEIQIVTNDETGLVANSIEECVELLNKLIALPTLRNRLSKNAIDYVKKTRSPEISALNFITLWLNLLKEPTKIHDFKAAIGEKPLDWFFATQNLYGIKEKLDTQEYQGASKGSLAHFQKVFTDDESFNEIRS